MAYGINEAVPNGAIPSTHSEVNAIRKMLNKRKQLNPKLFRKGVVMINLAFTYAGKLRRSEPCRHCRRYLKKYNFVKSMWYSTQDGKFHKYM